MRRRLLTVGMAFVIAAVALAYVGAPYARAASLVVRAASLGGRVEAFANGRARAVTVHPRDRKSVV